MNQEVTGQEIEVTPEMILAGCAVIWDWDPEYESTKELASNVFSAMLALSKRNSEQTS